MPSIDFSLLNGHQDMLPPGTPDVARLRADGVQLLTQIDEREQLHTKKLYRFLLACGTHFIAWNRLVS